jgi:hypothetical protein
VGVLHNPPDSLVLASVQGMADNGQCTSRDYQTTHQLWGRGFPTYELFPVSCLLQADGW